MPLIPKAHIPTQMRVHEHAANENECQMIMIDAHGSVMC